MRTTQMDFDLSNTRTWWIPVNGSTKEVYRVIDKNNVILWRKYYKVTYDDNNGQSPAYCTLRFNANGGSGNMADITQNSGSSVTIPACPFTRSGYILKTPQFNTRSDGTGTSYSVGSNITLTTNMTLYAQWQANSGLYISFNANGGSGSMNSMTNLSYNQVVTLNPCTFTRTGYNFDMWKTVINGYESYLLNEDSFLMPNQNMQLTAQWQAATYNLIVRPNNNSTTWPGIHDAHLPGKGTGIGETLSMTYDQPYPTLPLPIATGFTFYRWYYVADDGRRDYLPVRPDGQITGNVDFACNITIWAQWQANTYTMTFDKQGGSSGTTTTTATYGQLIPNITIPTLTDKYFNGYYEGTNGTGKQYYDAYGKGLNVWNLTTNMTLYAYWTDSYSDPLLITDANELVQTTDGDFILT